MTNPTNQTAGAPNSVAPAETPAETIEEIASRPLVDYALLLKPRVMSLVLFTGYAGLALAPGSVDWLTGLLAVLFIALGAGASGAINMWYDRDIDKQMTRTMNRPIPAGRLKPAAALVLGSVLSIVSVVGMMIWVNDVSAALLAITIAFYVFIYTIWLKRRTPQNIVIGGAAGALPPMIGWAAVTGDVGLGSIVLFAIIFMWTPPHFWALSLYRSADYEKAGVPMLPVVSGAEETKRQMLIYTLILVPITLLPVPLGMTSYWTGGIIALLGANFIRHALRVRKMDDTVDDSIAVPRAMFRYSILYLFLVFVALLADRWIGSIL